MPKLHRLVGLGLAGALLLAEGDAEAMLRLTPGSLGLGERAWQELGVGAMRGVTIGPIESGLHPNRGYGSPAFERSLIEAKRMGATWVSLTPFGRVLNLKPTGVAMTFEQPFEENRRAVKRAIAQAHAQGLRVLLVPHLWVESGEWRAEIEPGDDVAWARWAEGYTRFVRAWAEVARDAEVDLLAVGVELRSWLTTARAASFHAVIAEVRRIYPGLLTYAGNWDDVEETTILGQLDVIGINAFYPLSDREGASPEELAAGGHAVAKRVARLAEAFHKPVVFTEFGYTTRPNPAVRPWEWPDFMSNVTVDQAAQADAYAALLAPMLDEPWFAGAFVWRTYADPDDMSQEAEWGFSPRGKLAELVLRDAFAARWAGDGAYATSAGFTTPSAAFLDCY
ncbi:MAG: glycoside hydrolase family 113 [Myxococcota bacterium]